MMPLKTVFMGTPDFAVPSLKILADVTSVAAVVTQPDKPKGRGQKLLPSPVKLFAAEKNITVLQPPKVREAAFIDELKLIAPDLIVVVAFGQILPKAILDIPRFGCINVHASLLPKLRGAAPMQWCLINGDKKTGVTTMFMDEGLDTGDMLLKGEVSVGDDMTLPELHDALSETGARVLAETIERLRAGTLSREKQNDAEFTYAPMIKKDTGLIDWQKSAQEIHNLVRGLNSFASAYTFLRGQRYKIHRTRVVTQNEQTGHRPGNIIRADKGGLFVSCGRGMLEISELQTDGKRKMSAAQFLNGRELALPAFFDSSAEG